MAGDGRSLKCVGAEAVQTCCYLSSGIRKVLHTKSQESPSEQASSCAHFTHTSAGVSCARTGDVFRKRRGSTRQEVLLNLHPVSLRREQSRNLVHIHARTRRCGGEKAPVAASEAWGFRGFADCSH